MSAPKPQEEKLIPLRKFVVPGVYSAAYLSQLVQKKTLKATKIGRNFFTCEKWMNQYLECHAHDAKNEKYLAFLKKQKENNNKINMGENGFFLESQGKKKINLYVLSESKQKAINKRNISRAIAITAAIAFLLFVNVYFLVLKNNQGRIAGEEEPTDDSHATGTEIIYLNAKN